MKYDLLSRNNKVCFEMDCGHMLFTEMERGNCTMCYESVIGFGVVEDVPEEQKKEALDILMEHYPVPAGFHYNEAIVPHTRVLKLTVESLTGKTPGEKIRKYSYGVMARGVLKGNSGRPVSAVRQRENSWERKFNNIFRRE